MLPRVAVASVAASVFLAGCSGAEAESAQDVGDAGQDAAPIGGDRPVDVYVPASYAAGQPAALVVMLHGYSVGGAIEELYLRLATVAEERGFLYAHPDGTIDSKGNYFWNATDACCNVDGSDVDDSSYLDGIVTAIESRYSVDPKRIYFVGHSNGGFMSYRMACDHADKIAAIASLAGAMFEDVSKCAASSPVSTLQIHGTADEEVLYDGSSAEHYPSATTTTSDWAAIDGCSPVPDTSGGPLDLDVEIAGAETTVTSYAAGCEPGGHAELWTIQGGSHIPDIASDFGARIVDFLYAHAKP